MRREPRFAVVDDPVSAAVELIREAVLDGVESRGEAALCLSGGSTPLPVYRRLAELRELPWEHVTFTWGDERWVPHDHPDSNFGSARAALLDHLPVPDEQVLPWPYGDDPAAAARAHAAALVERLGPAAPGRALFDLNLMGLGSDGHTASLFPGTGAALRSELAFATEVPRVGWRLTLGAPALSSSRTVVFLVTGAEKRRALAATWPAAWRSARPGGGAARTSPSGAATAARSGASARTAEVDARSQARGNPAGRQGAASVDSLPARAISALEDLVVVTDQRPEGLPP